MMPKPRSTIADPFAVYGFPAASILAALNAKQQDLLREYTNKVASKVYRIAYDSGADSLPKDVVRLVIAGRHCAFETPDAKALKELDTASEAFAARIPWDDEPKDSSCV